MKRRKVKLFNFADLFCKSMYRQFPIFSSNYCHHKYMAVAQMIAKWLCISLSSTAQKILIHCLEWNFLPGTWQQIYLYFQTGLCSLYLHTKNCLFQHNSSFKLVYLQDTTYFLLKYINYYNSEVSQKYGVQSFIDLNSER